MKAFEAHTQATESQTFFEKIVAFVKLSKLRLSFLVVFSTIIGFILGKGGGVGYFELLMVFLGGFLVTASANTFNQLSEIDVDALMDRTKNRPLPTHQISKTEALWFALVSMLVGLAILFYFFNLLTAILSLLSLILYAFVYTPLKRVGTVAVVVGAIPGALPPLIGWVASSGQISVEAICLFGIQFFWQFPHFWAIAWVLDEDYKKAGFKLLPGSGKKDISTAFQMMIYTLVLIPVSLLPLKLGLTGVNSALIALVCGVLFLAQTFYLMQTQTKEAALRIMFGSFLYLPIVQIAFVLDRI